MSNVKERIFGAVTIMSDEDAEKVWNLIQATFLLNNVEEVTPDPDEIAALNAYHSGDPDYQPAMSQEEVYSKSLHGKVVSHLTYEQLLDAADQEGLAVKEQPLSTHDGLIIGSHIAI